eukprot:1159282-Pelagomonas_calceolata.AAC.4
MPMDGYHSFKPSASRHQHRRVDSYESDEEDVGGDQHTVDIYAPLFASVLKQLHRSVFMYEVHSVSRSWLRLNGFCLLHAWEHFWSAWPEKRVLAPWENEYAE